MNTAFLQAAVPEPFRILGKRLKPFSLGHQILLQRFGSNFAEGSRDTPGYADLILSVFICSRSYSDALTALSSRWLMWRLRLWGLLWRRFDVGEKIMLFYRYISEHTKVPDYWILQEGNGDLGAPWVQFLKVRMRQDFGESEEGALNTPYPTALFNYLTNLENKGVIKFIDEREAAQIAHAKKLENDPKFQKALERAIAANKEANKKVALPTKPRGGMNGIP